MLSGKTGRKGFHMKKIPTLFVRLYGNHEVIGICDKLTDESLQIVLDGQTLPTVKYDGSACMISGKKLYKRYDAKKGKKVPVGAIPCQPEPDPITGHFPHWIELNADNPADKWYLEAFENAFALSFTDASMIFDSGKEHTFEAIGPHFQGNPYNLSYDTVVAHGFKLIPELQGIKLSFSIIKDYLKTSYIEGIVFWYDDKPLCKIKRTDFGFDWKVKTQ